MPNYIHQSLEELFDLLSEKTDKLSEIFKTGQYGSAEYMECRDTIREIQRIIRQKKKLQISSTELPNVERSVATEDDSSTSADYQ